MGATRTGSLSSALAVAGRGLDPMFSSHVDEMGEELLEQVQRFTPVADFTKRWTSYTMIMAAPRWRTYTWRPPGTLRASMRREGAMRTAGGWMSSVYTEDPIAAFVEWDTRPHVISTRGDARPGSLRWVSFGSGAMFRWAKEVMHPGTTGAHMMAKGAFAIAAIAEERGEAAVRGWARRSGFAVRS